MKKKLLIFAHYYAPDVASTGQIIQDLAEGLLEDLDITVICVVPSYSGKIKENYKKKPYYIEINNDVKVFRVRVSEFKKSNKLSRIRNILDYFIGALKAIFKVGPQDYILSISQPPVLGGLLGVFAARVKKCKFIYNIQDFNPEQIMAVGYSRNKIVLRLMMLLDKYSCTKSDLVITVGRDLVETFKKRFPKSSFNKIIYINNWINEKEIFPLERKNSGIQAFVNKFGLSGKYIIMYSGNIGYYYDLINILKVLIDFKPGTKASDGREVCFVFVGEGSILDDLKIFKKENKMDNVVFIPYQEKEKLIYSLNSADVHWCINARGIKGVSCPSKYYGIAACSKPTIAVLEKNSEIRLIIEQTKGGLISDPENYQSIRDNILWFIENANNVEINLMGQRAHEYLLTNLTKEKSINKYRDEILKI